MLSIFDPHIHMDNRSCHEYEQLALAQVTRILIPTSPTGERRHSRSSFGARFDRLLGFETERAGHFGINAQVALAVNAADVADMRSALGALSELAARLADRRVAAIGEIAFRSFSNDEMLLCIRQASLAERTGLPVIIEAPITMTDFAKLVQLLDSMFAKGTVSPHRVCLVDLNREKLQQVRHLGLAGYGIPVSPPWEGPFAIREKLHHAEIIRILDEGGAEGLMLNSGLHVGFADPLGLPKTILRLRLAGVADSTLEQIANLNAAEVFRDRRGQP